MDMEKYLEFECYPECFYHCLYRIRKYLLIWARRDGWERVDEEDEDRGWRAQSYRWQMFELPASSHVRCGQLLFFFAFFGSRFAFAFCVAFVADFSPQPLALFVCLWLWP